TWSLSAPMGSLVSTGTATAQYTAPSVITVPQSVTLTATADADPSQAANIAVNLQPTAAASGFAPIRVRAGGAAYTDALGQLWMADTGFNGGSAYATAAAIAGAGAQPLYQAERWSAAAFQYRFAVPNG